MTTTMAKRTTSTRSAKEKTAIVVAWGLIFFLIGDVLELAIGITGLGIVATLAGIGFGVFLNWKNYEDLPINRRYD